MSWVWVVIPLVLFGIVGIQDVDASCAKSQDWPEKPCFDYGAVQKTTFAERWSPYYEYKGSELMERKKIQMFQSLENKTFYGWVLEPENYSENYNIYSYYLSTGEIAKQFPLAVFTDEQEYMSPKKQQTFYTKPYDLKCRNDLRPVISQSENYACVKAQTAEKLIERGWTKAEDIPIPIPSLTSAPPDFRMVDINGNTLSHTTINEKTFFTYGVGHRDSSESTIEFEFIINSREESGDGRKQILYEKFIEKLKPDGSKYVTWSYVFEKPGEYLAIIISERDESSSLHIRVTPPSEALN